MHDWILKRLTIDWGGGDGSNPVRFLCTSSHPDESFDDVRNMVERWETERGDTVQVIRL